MKISMYTFLFEIDSKFYAYNTLSNALIEIAEDTYKILLVNKNRHTPLQGKRLSKYIFYSSFSLLTFATKK